MSDPTPAALTTVDDRTAAALTKFESIIPPEKYAEIITKGNYAALQPSEQAAFLFLYAHRKGLDPWRNPFQFINQDGKLILYAKKEAAAQLRKRDQLTPRVVYSGALRMEYEYVVLYTKHTDGKEEQKVELIPKTFDTSVYEVVVEVLDPGGIVLEREVGTAELGGLIGRERKDAIMKAYTRAKRRAILAAEGLSENDESEFDESMPDTKRKAPPTGPVRKVPPQEPPIDVPVKATGGNGPTPVADPPATTPVPPMPTKGPSKPPFPRA